MIEAKELALDIVIGDDGGSANLDRLALSLPRLKEENVIKAIKEAGLYTRGKCKWLGTRYFISAPYGSQGNDNTKQIEVMHKCLKDKGYDVLIYYQVD